MQQAHLPWAVSRGRSGRKKDSALRCGLRKRVARWPRARPLQLQAKEQFLDSHAPLCWCTATSAKSEVPMAHLTRSVVVRTATARIQTTQLGVLVQFSPCSLPQAATAVSRSNTPLKARPFALPPGGDRWCSCSSRSAASPSSASKASAISCDESEGGGQEPVTLLVKRGQSRSVAPRFAQPAVHELTLQAASPTIPSHPCSRCPQRTW